MARFKVLRRQRPIKGGRDPLPSCVLHEIRAAVEARAEQFGVSKSFVIAVTLAKAFGITGQENYMRPPSPRGADEDGK